jgi:DNA topoisomerase-1
MEESLDLVEEGKLDWTKILKDFYGEFMRELEKASSEMTSEHGKTVEEACPLCQAALTQRWTRYGRLTECACGYKKPDNLVPDQFCPQCNSPMAFRRGRLGKFLSCSRYPDCKGTKSMVRGRVVNVPEGYDLKCEKSGHPMAVRMSRRGAFLGCTGYPDCRNAKKIPAQWMRKK